MGTVLVAGSLAHVAVADVGLIRHSGHSVAQGLAAPLWALAGIDTAVLGMGLWLVFAIQYAGLRGRVIWMVVAVSAVIPTVVLGVTALWFLLGDGLPSVVSASLGVLSLIMSSLVIVGAFFLLSEGTKPNAFPLGLSILLSGGALVLALVPVVLSTFIVPVTVPASYFLASGLFGVAVHRYPTFETLPVARVAGRDRVIEEMEDAVLVVDPETVVRDLNPAAERAFDVDRSSVIGRPVSTLLPAWADPDALETAGDPVRVRTGTGTTLAVTTSRVTDPYGHLVGHLLVCQDVTERLNRERRLSVLNQLLIGIVRERMGAVADDAASLFDANSGRPHPVDGPPPSPANTRSGSGVPSDPAAVGDHIWTTTTELMRIVSHAREIERTLSGEDDAVAIESHDIRETVSGVGECSTPGDRIEVSTEVPDDPVPAGISPSILRVVLELLVTESRDHAADAVEIVVDDRGGASVIDVVDDRKRGGNSHHTQEFAVGMTRLAIEYYGGDVSVSWPDAGGRRVVVELPPGRAVPGTGSVGAQRRKNEESRPPDGGREP